MPQTVLPESRGPFATRLFALRHWIDWRPRTCRIVVNCTVPEFIRTMASVHLLRRTRKVDGVADGIRTHDNRNHNPGLYQLSYGRLSDRDDAPDGRAETPATHRYEGSGRRPPQTRRPAPHAAKKV